MLHSKRPPQAIAILFFLLSALPTVAQDTLYFNERYERALNPATARYFEVRNFDPTDSKRCTVGIFYADSNSIISVKRYSNYEQLIYDGKCTDWYKNGSVYRESRYKNGLLQGEEKVY